MHCHAQDIVHDKFTAECQGKRNFEIGGSWDELADSLWLMAQYL